MPPTPVNAVPLSSPPESVSSDKEAVPSQHQEPKDQHGYLAIIGDQQNHESSNWGFHDSLMISTRAPNHRLPPMNLGVPFTHEALVREVIKPAQRARLRGILSTGDVVDVNNTEELQSYFGVLDRLEKVHPNFKELQLAIGNHDVFHYGNTRSGYDFFGILGLLLNLQGQRSYKQDIHIPAVGDATHVLGKDTLIAELYHQKYGHDPQPTELMGDATRTHYTHYGSGPEPVSRKWVHSSRVFRDFWRQEKNGDWNALVRMNNGRKHPEERWLMVSATKLTDFKAGRVQHPVYVITLDTMDYLGTKTSLGALQGHISPYQVKLVKAFIAYVKGTLKQDKAKFIIHGHYPAEQIVEFRWSGLNQIFSSKSVIAYVAGHTHKRGFADLARGQTKEKLDIQRDTPLPQIVVPAVMDYPNEMALLRYSVDSKDPQQLVFEWRFRGLNADRLPGNSAAVCDALKKARPHFVTYLDSLKHIKDPQIAEFANPWTPIGRQIDLLLHGDTGILSRPGNVHDEIIANDVIPSLVEEAQSYFRLFRGVVTLALRETGLMAEAVQFEARYTQRVDHLDSYYERMWAGDYSSLSGATRGLEQIDRFDREYDEATHDILGSVRQTQKNVDRSAQQRVLLKRLEHLLPALKSFVGAYRAWLVKYEKSLRTNRDPKELINDADLFGSPSFKAMTQHIEQLPYGSWPVAFLIHAHLEASEQYQEFYKGAKSLRQKVPDRIRVEVAMQTGDIRLVTSARPDPKAAIHRRHWCEPASPERAFAANARSQSKQLISDRGKRGIEGHWSLRPGLGLYPQFPTVFPLKRYTASLEVGGQWHVLNQWNRPRVNLFLRGGGLIEGRRRQGVNPNGEGRADDFSWELGAKTGVTIGDPYGLVALGPILYGGFGRRGLNDSNPIRRSVIGTGGSLDLLEGALWLEVNHKWYSDDEQSTGYLMGTDLFRLGAYFFGRPERDF